MASMRFQSSAPKCPSCGKSVYAAEEVKALGQSWHSLCFCCKACGKSLRGGRYKEHGGAPYCEADHAKLFGPKGIGFGSTLGDTGIASTPAAVAEPEEGSSDPADAGAVPAVMPAAVEKAVSVSPGVVQEESSQVEGGGNVAAKRSGSLLGTSAPKCPQCGKSVFIAEEVRALGRSWHPGCFCCGECGKSLRAGQYRDHQGVPYCDADYRRLFAPKGIGFGSTLGDTGAPPTAEPDESSATGTSNAAADGASAPLDPAAAAEKSTAASETVAKATGPEAAEAPAGPSLRERMAAFQKTPEKAPPPAARSAPSGGRFQSNNPKCPSCNKSVYAAEEVKGLGRSWHPLCFCCKACGKSLRGGHYKEHDGWPYCEADHSKLFGPKGIGFGTTLGDTGVGGTADVVQEAPKAAGQSAESVEQQAPPAPTSAAAGPAVTAKLGAGTAPQCPSCGKSVYAAEEVLALGRSWHALCFCCAACCKSLRGGQFREHDGRPYCEADHAKLFGVKGIGFGNTLGDTGIAAAPEAGGS